MVKDDLYFVVPFDITEFLFNLDDVQLSRLRDEVVYLCRKREESRNEG